MAFCSSAPNLVPGDTNGTYDVFVRDRTAGTTELISVSSGGEQGNNSSLYPSISADGRYVAYISLASNLVPNDTNGTYDVFVRDRTAGTTERVSVSSSGEQGNNRSWVPAISSDGRHIAFHSYASNLVLGDTNGITDVFVRDRLAGITERVSISSSGEQASGESFTPSISGDGRFVAFDSYDYNLVPGDTNGRIDVFVRDRLTTTTERVSVSSCGTQGNANSQNYSNRSISADGRYMAFVSWASNLVSGDTHGYMDVFVRDRWGIGDIKALPDGEEVEISASTVTASTNIYWTQDPPNPNFYYLQDADRSTGIKIKGTSPGAVGERCFVRGWLGTEKGERVIYASHSHHVDALPVAPLGIRTSNLGGSDKDYNPITGAGSGASPALPA